MPDFIIIDGYNLLHTLGTRRSLGGPGNLQRAREGLAGRIAARMSPEQRSRTMIVFDANNENRELPPETIVSGIEVVFARDFLDADSMIEHLLRKHSTPQQVVVVSNDRRVRQAAERRRARAVDCESWFDSLGREPERDEAEKREQEDEEAELRQPQLSPVEREAWLKLFGGAGKPRRNEGRTED